MLMKPTDDEGRFNKIIYFKENPNVPIPTKLSIYGDNKSFTGYGFFKKNELPPPEIAKMPPSYLPYDAWVNKLNISATEYNKMKNNSFVRIETENYAGYNKNANRIYIADRDPLIYPNALDFIEENRNKNFIFLNPLIVNDEATFLKFSGYRVLFNKDFILNFKYTEDLFFDNWKDVIFKLDKFDSETEENYQKRIIKMALWYKGNNTTFRFPYKINYSELTNKIIEWAQNNSVRTSYAEYHKLSKKDQAEIAALPTELRLLLKQNPQSITRQNLDLKANL